MYYIISYGITAAICLGVMSGLLSSYLVNKKMSLLGDIMSHASFPGIVFMFFFTHSANTLLLIFGGAIAALLSSLSVFYIQKYASIPKDTALALILCFFFSLGLLGLGMVQKKGILGQSILNNFIFGNFVSITKTDIIILIIITSIIFLFFILTKSIQGHSCFDPLYVKLNVPSIKSIDLILLITTVLGIVCSLKIVGILLTSALLITPGTIGRLWGKSYSQIQLISLFSSIFSSLAGILFSIKYTFLPAGPLIILILTITCISSVLYKMVFL